jgi:MoxR-like ATPase
LEGYQITSDEISVIQKKFKIVGRHDELEKAIAAVKTSKHILIEGSVGIGKTMLAEAIAKYSNRNIYRIDGDERYTEQKLVGWFDPPIVMTKGYCPEAFIPGPLVEAMRDGSFLFVNELNRMPEGTQNVLLPAMDEKHIVVPKIGKVKAKDGFIIIATQNPEEYIGTSRLSEALKDRFVWIKLGHQSEEEEIEIVRKETKSLDLNLIQIAVAITRKTRECTELRRGASVRGAIDIVALTPALSRHHNKNGLDAQERAKIIENASIMALTPKVESREASGEKLEEILKKIVDEVLTNKTLEKSSTGDEAEESKERTQNF